MAEYNTLSYTLHARLIAYPHDQPESSTPWFPISDGSSLSQTAAALLATADEFPSAAILCTSPLTPSSEPLTHETISLPTGTSDAVTLPTTAAALHKRLYHGKLRWDSWLSHTSAVPRGPISSLRGSNVSLPTKELKSLDVDNGPAILLAEDNAINQMVFRAIMARKVGFTAFKIVENGQLALDVYKAHPELYRCIFMDKAMPVMAGDEATVLIREFERAAGLERAVIVSVCAGNALRPDDRTSAHYDYFLDKPLHGHHLNSIFDDIMGREAAAYKRAENVD